jgi:hypothetical protein
VKTLSSTSFFRTFDLLIGTSNPGLKLDVWDVDGVRFEHSRHSFGGGSYCFAIDMFILTKSGRRGWQLMVAKEFWWTSGHKRPLRSQHWSHAIDGSRRDILMWLRACEQSLERRPRMVDQSP